MINTHGRRFWGPASSHIEIGGHGNRAKRLVPASWRRSVPSTAKRRCSRIEQHDLGSALARYPPGAAVGQHQQRRRLPAPALIAQCADKRTRGDRGAGLRDRVSGRSNTPASCRCRASGAVQRCRQTARRGRAGAQYNALPQGRASCFGSPPRRYLNYVSELPRGAPPFE
jgi:hypothetical protein